jgi:hypothetical protein
MPSLVRIHWVKRSSGLSIIRTNEAKDISGSGPFQHASVRDSRDSTAGVPIQIRTPSSLNESQKHGLARRARLNDVNWIQRAQNKFERRYFFNKVTNRECSSLVEIISVWRWVRILPP